MNSVPAVMVEVLVKRTIRLVVERGIILHDVCVVCNKKLKHPACLGIASPCRWYSDAHFKCGEVRRKKQAIVRRINSLWHRKMQAEKMIKIWLASISDKQIQPKDWERLENDIAETMKD